MLDALSSNIQTIDNVLQNWVGFLQCLSHQLFKLNYFPWIIRKCLNKVHDTKRKVKVGLCLLYQCSYALRCLRRHHGLVCMLPVKGLLLMLEIPVLRLTFNPLSCEASCLLRHTWTMHVYLPSVSELGTTDGFRGSPWFQIAPKVLYRRKWARSQVTSAKELATTTKQRFMVLFDFRSC